MTARDVAFPVQSRLPARPFGQRGPGRSLEALLVVLIVGIVIFEALHGARLGLAKIHVLNAISLSTTERADAVEALATTGVLPDRVVPQPPRPLPGAGRLFGPPQWRDGELVFPGTERLLRLLAGGGDEAVVRDAAVAFRVARAPGSGAIVWLCGGESAPMGFGAAPPRHTTIEPRHLPHFCR